MRARVSEKKLTDVTAVRSVVLEPTVFGPGADVSWLSENERALVLNQMDARLCFAMSKHFALATDGARADARVRAAVTLLRPTGKAGSGASAVAGVFIPGPIGIRVPDGLGALGAEAEMVDARTSAQLAAVTFSRRANWLGTDSPSLSRVGDALQFAGPFARAAEKAFAPKGAALRKIDSQNDPCKQYGPRFRPEGFAAKVATGLYVPSLGAAKQPDAKAKGGASEKTN
jgi:hypothetical protein